jgi:hypothetical protein
MGKITRRLAIGLAGLTGAGVLAYGGSLVACRFVPRKHPDFFVLLDTVPGDETARRIGKAIVASGHAPADLDRLQAIVLERPHVRTALATDCPVTRKRLVQDQCSADFAEGRMVSVEGWVLSETEANLCAAAWLAEGRMA